MRISFQYYCIAFIFVIILLQQPALARPIIADLSIRSIEIDAGFTGTDILLFGARQDAGDIIVVIRGPKAPYIVRKKERIAGIWINRKHATFSPVHGYYAIASTKPLEAIRNDYLLQTLQIGTNNLKISSTNFNDSMKLQQFRDALFFSMQEKQLYPIETSHVEFMGDTLFRTLIHFPENIPKGTYTAEIYLIRDGILSSIQSTPIKVNKIGFEAFVHDFAYSHSALYGITAIFLALGGGWIAGLLFRKV